MRKKVKVVDYCGIKSFHEVFNTALVIMCAQIFDEVVYVAGRTSCENTKRCFLKHNKRADSAVCFRARPVCESDTNFGAFLRTIWGSFVTLKEYLFNQKDTVLIFNYTNPLSMPLILLLNYLLQKKVIYVMHGELELLINKDLPFFKASFWYRVCHRVSFKYFLRENRAFVLVLGKSIKDNLCKIYKDISSNVYFICHPYFIDSYTIKPRKGILTIGTVGVMKKEKGLEDLVKLSEVLRDEISKNKLVIKSIGKVERIDISHYKYIQWIGGENMLPRNEFDQAIQSLDYIIYLYPVNSYKFTASGAVMDAVKLGKPIIAFHNDYFDYLFSNARIGYLVNDLSEMVHIIKDLIEKYRKNDYSGAFETLKKKVSIEENANLLKQILQERMFIV